MQHLQQPLSASRLASDFGASDIGFDDILVAEWPRLFRYTPMPVQLPLQLQYGLY